jgi:peptidylprolyl isomerase
MSEPVKAGDTISVQYTGKFEDGSVFDSSEGKQPLKFTVGKGQLIKGFDNAVVGMLKGDKKTVTIPPEEGYGPYMEDRVIDMPKDNVPEGMDVKVDMMVQLNDQAGNPIPARVVEITDKAVKLDLNNPLAGKTLMFDIEVVGTGLDPDHQCGDGNSGCGSCCGGCGS